LTYYTYAVGDTHCRGCHCGFTLAVAALTSDYKNEMVSRN